MGKFVKSGAFLILSFLVIDLANAQNIYDITKFNIIGISIGDNIDGVYDKFPAIKTKQKERNNLLKDDRSYRQSKIINDRVINKGNLKRDFYLRSENDRNKIVDRLGDYMKLLEWGQYDFWGESDLQESGARYLGINFTPMGEVYKVQLKTSAEDSSIYDCKSVGRQVTERFGQPNESKIKTGTGRGYSWFGIWYGTSQPLKGGMFSDMGEEMFSGPRKSVPFSLRAGKEKVFYEVKCIPSNIDIVLVDETILSSSMSILSSELRRILDE